MKQALPCVFAISLLAASSAWAAPGEWWEITTRTEMAGMPFSMPETKMRVCIEKGAGSDARPELQDGCPQDQRQPLHLENALQP